LVLHPRESFNSGGATQQKHGHHNSIGQKAKEQKCLVDSATPTGIDNLGDCMRRWSHLLELDGQDTKEQNLNSGT
jgi:hypothetical protein